MRFDPVGVALHSGLISFKKSQLIEGPMDFRIL
jgi:hypothetical protein